MPDRLYRRGRYFRAALLPPAKIQGLKDRFARRSWKGSRQIARPQIYGSAKEDQALPLSGTGFLKQKALWLRNASVCSQFLLHENRAKWAQLRRPSKQQQTRLRPSWADCCSKWPLYHPSRFPSTRARPLLRSLYTIIRCKYRGFHRRNPKPDGFRFLKLFLSVNLPVCSYSSPPS